MTPYEQIWHTRYNNKDINENLEEYAKQIPVLKEHCLEAVDFRTVFDDVKTTIYLDNGHVNGLGNKIIAEGMYKLILPHT